MDLIAYDPYANPSLAASANVDIVPTMDELFERADFLTIHTPMIASTKGLIGMSELSKMKPTARILNVARGGIVDEKALLEALDSGVIAGAGIDVFTSEPPKPDDTASKLIGKFLETYIGPESDPRKPIPKSSPHLTLALRPSKLKRTSPSMYAHKC